MPRRILKKTQKAHSENIQGNAQSKSTLSLLVLALVSVGVFAVATRTTPVANAVDYCQNRYAKGVAIPSGYGAAYNLFSSAGETVLKFECDAQSNAILHAASTDANHAHVVYKNGFRWNGASWIPITFTGTLVPGTTDWLQSGARVSISASQLLPSNAYSYVAAYTCALEGGDWKCGCRESSCAVSNWQLQATSKYAPPPATTAGITTTGGSGGSGGSGGGTGSYNGNRAYTPTAWPTTGTDGNKTLGGVMFGNPLTGETGLGPQKIGQGRYVLSNRFRAEKTGTVDQIQWQMRWNTHCQVGQAGVDGNCDMPGEYSTGDGGRIVIEIRADDNGVPAAVIGETNSFTPVVFKAWNGSRACSGSFCDVCFRPTYPHAQREYTAGMQNSTEACVAGDLVADDNLTDNNQTPRLKSPISLTAGNMYHMVLRNLEANDQIYIETNTSLTGEPGPWLNDWRVLRTSGTWSGTGGTWGEVPKYKDLFDIFSIPQMQLHYTDGTWVGPAGLTYQTNSADQAVNSGRQVRQEFDVRGGDRKVTGVWVRVTKSSLVTQPLNVTIKESDGTSLVTGSIDPSDVVITNYATGDYGKWHYIQFPATQTLSNNKTYYIDFSSAGSYSILGRTDALGPNRVDRNMMYGLQRVRASTNGGSSWSDPLKTSSGAYNFALGVLFTIEGMPTEF